MRSFTKNSAVVREEQRGCSRTVNKISSTKNKNGQQKRKKREAGNTASQDLQLLVGQTRLSGNIAPLPIDLWTLLTWDYLILLFQGLQWLMLECGCKIVQSVAVNSLNCSMWNSVGDTSADGFGNDIIRSYYSDRVLSHAKRALFKIILYLCIIFAPMPWFFRSDRGGRAGMTLLKGVYLALWFWLFETSQTSNCSSKTKQRWMSHGYVFILLYLLY